MPARRLLCVAVLLFAAGSPAFGQPTGIVWGFTYTDSAGTGNATNSDFGFNDNFIDAGQTESRATLRKGSLTVATQYLNRYLDGRGTITANLDQSDHNIATPTLASFGTNVNQLTAPTSGGVVQGTFQNGGFYQAGRTSERVNGANPDGNGQFNFGYKWNYANQVGAPANDAIDMVTVAIHELTHGLGFNAFTQSSGQGLTSQTLGNPDLYAGYSKYMQRGNTAGAGGLFNTTLSSTGYGAFTGPLSTLTNGSTNTTTGLFFGGQYTREVYGSAAPLYAPNPFEGGSSLSHVNDSTAVMNPSVSYNTVKRFRPYEVAMLLDIGWNVYNWDGAGGNWGDGINGNVDTSTSYTLANSNWRTDIGIVRSTTQNAYYNIRVAQGEAPILPMWGQVTANIVLNFKASGTTSYTSTNNFANTILLSRINLNSTSSNAITIAGGTLSFGRNADGTPSVLVPKIVQGGSGAVTISSALVTNTVATQTVDGVSFTGHTGVTVEGTGGGAVTLAGGISGSGGVTKNGVFSLTYASTTAATYTGTTAVTAGALYVNGSLSSTTNGVTVSGGTLGGTGTISRAITVNSGGTLEGGTTSTLGTLGVKAATTLNSGGKLRAELGSGTSSDKLDMTGAAHTLTFKDGTFIDLSASGFTRTATTYTLADLNGTGTLLKVSNGTTDLDVAAGATITTFTSTGGNGGSNDNTIGNVDLTLSNFTAGNMQNGDRLILSRQAGTGDLVLTFTPVPEPAGVLLACGLAAAGVAAWRRWKK